MKLMVDARTFGKNPSGVGIYGYRFVKTILERTDWEVVLLSDVAESAEIRRVSYTDLGFDNLEPCRDSEDGCSKGASGNIAKLVLYGKEVTKSVGVFGYFRFIQQVINEEKPDIFWEINNLYPIRLKNPYGRIAVTIHDLFPLSMPECFTKTYPYYFRMGLKKTLATTDALIYDSNTIKKEVESVYPKAKGKRSFTAYAIASGSKNTDIDDSIVGGDEEYFLYIGNLEKRKGTDLLLKAYEKYRAAGGTSGLHLAGKIREDDIKKLVDSAINNDKKVAYLGYLSDIDKNKQLLGCSAFIFPSRAEGFGIPIIEALSFGKPVLASNLPIFDELFQRSVNTFDISADDEQIVSNMAEAMADIRIIDPFEVDQTVNRYMADVLAPGLISFFEELSQ